MNMHKNFHRRDDKDRNHMSRKEGGREIAIIENDVDISKQRLGKWTKKPRKTNYSGRL